LCQDLSQNGGEPFSSSEGHKREAEKNEYNDEFSQVRCLPV
jgi:hypothetical protein